MAASESSVHRLLDPDGELERAFIGEFLRTQGHDARSLDTLADDERTRLHEAASAYASGKLAEIRARAHFVHQLHGEA